MEELVLRIRGYLKILNKNVDAIDTANQGLINFCIAEVIDRTLLYLNTETVPAKVERILAEIVNTGLKKVLKEMEIKSGVEQAVSSLSDNGQSVSYSNELTRYFTTVSDEELFTGFSSLLTRYRRIKVVYSTIV